MREQKVVLDSDLAAIYGVTTGRFNEAVKQNLKRFPGDFAFALTKEENLALRSQFAILEKGRGRHRKYLPRVFTEHGALMAASILNSERAIAMSIYVIRAFVELRERLGANAAILKRLAEIDRELPGSRHGASGRLRKTATASRLIAGASTSTDRIFFSVKRGDRSIPNSGGPNPAFGK